MPNLNKLRLRCFFDVSIAEDNIGRIIFELFNDVCPKTCENFKALCTGERGVGKFTDKPLHYKNTAFHRVVRNFIIQSGDFSQGNGKGGESIYGGTFEDESFDFKHDKPFLLSMANRGKNTNGSQFFITLAPAPHLDSVHVVFGHVIQGEDVVMKIANQAVDKNSKPLVQIRISNCGELIPQIKSKEKKKKGKAESSEISSSGSSDSDSSSSSSNEDSDSDSDSSSEEEGEIRGEKNRIEEHESKTTQGNGVAIPINDLPNAPKIYANIKADEIPEVPQNRFLYRGFKSKPTDEAEKQTPDRRETDRKERRERSKKYSYSKSGRKIKGRGFLRFRTPSPRSSRHRRSETPPHWKTEQAKTKTFKEALSRSSDGRRRREREWSQESRKKEYKSHSEGGEFRSNRRNRSRSIEKRHRHSSQAEHSKRDSKYVRSEIHDNDYHHRRRKRSRSKSSSDAEEHKNKEQKENFNANIHSDRNKENGDDKTRHQSQIENVEESRIRSE